MCGLAGIVGPPGTDYGSSAQAMREALVHRGPDDEGLKSWPELGVALGHQRLSIIDLSAAGRQPMPNEDETVWIVFNGEIYNYRELRNELRSASHGFRSDTDTEVIVHAYEEWGIECVRRLRGMFAFAIWDSRARHLCLARDRLGIKPMYYRVDESALRFASEPKGILADPSVPRRIDRDALLDYLTYGYVPRDRSIFEGFRKLPPAHVLTYTDGHASLTRYWDVEPDVCEGGAEDLVEPLRETVRDAVRSHMVSDVPVGTFLSGGIDSSLVTAMMDGTSGDPVRTITVVFDRGTSETPYARSVARAYETEHHEQEVTLAGAEDTLATLASVYDEPFADVSSVPTYHVCEAGRRLVKVALSGDGGDELFAGYKWYPHELRLADRSRYLPARPALSAAVQAVRRVPFLARVAVLARALAPDDLTRHLQFVGLFDEFEQRRLLGDEFRGGRENGDRLWLFREFHRPDLPLLTALQLLDLRTYLPDDILVKVDRASMAHSLEVRPPLLDHRVAELAFRIPPRLQLRDGETKWLLRRAASSLLPEPVMTRGKRGFSPPLTAWFKERLWEFARARLLHGALVEDGVLNADFIEWMVRNLTFNRWAKVWSLLMLEEWYRRWIVEA